MVSRGKEKGRMDLEEQRQLSVVVGLELNRDKLKKTRSEKKSRRWAVAGCWEHGEQ